MEGSRDKAARRPAICKRSPLSDAAFHSAPEAVRASTSTGAHSAREERLHTLSLRCTRQNGGRALSCAEKNPGLHHRFRILSGKAQPHPPVSVCETTYCR